MATMRKSPISTRLKVVIMSASVLSVVLVVVGFVTYEFVTFRHILVNDLATKAEMIGQNCTAALMFSNKGDAQQTLQASESQPHVQVGAVYGKDGQVFALYKRTGTSSVVPGHPESDGYYFGQGSLRLFQPVMMNKERIGTVYFESDLTELNDRVVSYGTIAALVLVGALGAAYLLASRLQKNISQPILDLAETSRIVSERQDFSVRAHKTSNDELGLLADAFNQMLSQIQSRDSNLRDANESMVREIGERKNVERELRVSEERYRSLVSGLTSIVWTADQEGKFAAPQKLWEKYTGQRWEEHAGFGWLDALHPENRRQIKNLWEQARNSRSLFECEGRIWQAQSKSYRYFTLRAVPLFDPDRRVREWIGTVTDVHDRKEAEETRLKLVAIVESSDDAIVGKSLDGIITSWNPGAEKVFGYRAQEVIGQSALMLIPADRAGEETDILARISRGERITHFETVRVRKDRTLIHISATISPIKDNRGNVIGASKIARDITERRRAEDEIRRLNEELERRVIDRTAQLEAANKELEAFSYSVSHDLRAPLRSIDGFGQALLEDYEAKLDEKGKDFLGRVRAASQRMGQLIDDLLNLSRVSRGEMRREKVDLSKIANTIAEDYLRSPEDRQVKFEIAPGIAAEGDPRLLRIAMENLLGNAWKYTRNHSRATISFGVHQDNGVPAYFVRDDGAGFDMTYADKLFGAFQRLHKITEFPGTGIGLATVQRIIHRHGGKIWAKGKVENGATFYFTLS